jgi:hypothetical protein
MDYFHPPRNTRQLSEVAPIKVQLPPPTAPLRERLRYHYPYTAGRQFPSFIRHRISPRGYED